MNQKKRRLTALLLAVLLLLAMAEPVGLVEEVRAVTQSDIDKLKKEKSAAAGERKDVENQISKLKDDIDGAIAKRTKLDEQIAATEREIASTEALISSYEQMLAQIAEELLENEKDEAEQYALFCERARVMEESGTTSYWSVLFKADSFSDLLSRLSDVQEVMNYDQNVLDSLRRLRSGIEAKQAYQEQLKEEAEEAKADLQSAKASLDNQRKEANAIVVQLQSDMAAQEKLLKEKENEEAKIQQEIKKKEKELADRLAREAAEAAAKAAAAGGSSSSTTWTATTGGYIWPESVSKKITSPMGSRNTGIPGASTNHKGVDIGGVGTTTTVVAAKAGAVIISKYSSSYGNYVVISHGPGNTTLYAHMSSRSVSEGATVSQGQAIGVTGNTGISRGAHLHYEITEGGSRVNPLNYLPGYVKSW